MASNYRTFKRIGEETMERKVGEIFESNGEKLVCAKGAVDASTDCRNCYFFNKNKSNNQCLGYLCAAFEREDSTNVFFKEIKE